MTNFKEFFSRHGSEKIKLFQGGGYITVLELSEAIEAKIRDSARPVKKVKVPDERA